MESGIAPPWFADLDHWPERGPQSLGLIPSFDTHPVLYMWPDGVGDPAQRFLTPFELYSAFGFDMFEQLSDGRPLSPATSFLPTICRSAQLRLIGNAFHSPMMTMWVLYVLGNSLDRKESWKLCGTIYAVSDADAFEDPDEAIWNEACSAFHGQKGQ